MTTPPVRTPTQIKFDASVLSQTDRIVGVATLVLFIAFFLPWFSYNTGFVVLTASGLTAHGYLYIPLILSIIVLAIYGAAALGVWSMPATAPLSRDQLLLICTAVNFILVLIGFLAKPGFSGIGWTWGAFVALIAAIVAVLPLARPALAARHRR